MLPQTYRCYISVSLLPTQTGNGMNDFARTQCVTRTEPLALRTGFVARDCHWLRIDGRLEIRTRCRNGCFNPVPRKPFQNNKRKQWRFCNNVKEANFCACPALTPITITQKTGLTYCDVTRTRCQRDRSFHNDMIRLVYHTWMPNWCAVWVAATAFRGSL